MHCNKEPTWHKTVLKIPMREVLSVYSNGSREKYEETDERICKDRIDSMLVTGPVM